MARTKITREQSVQGWEKISEFTGTFGNMASPTSLGISVDLTQYKFLKVMGRVEQKENITSTTSMRWRINNVATTSYVRRLTYFNGSTISYVMDDSIHMYIGASNWQSSGMQFELTGNLSYGWSAWQSQIYNDFENRSYIGWQRWNAAPITITSLQFFSDGAATYQGTVQVYGIR